MTKGCFADRRIASNAAAMIGFADLANQWPVQSLLRLMASSDPEHTMTAQSGRRSRNALVGRLSAWRRAGSAMAYRYVAHPDPLAEASNWFAITIGTHLPFWPLYVWWTVGRQAFPTVLLTVALAPLPRLGIMVQPGYGAAACDDVVPCTISRLAEISFDTMSRAVLPWLIPLRVVLAMITRWPLVTTWLPDWLMPETMPAISVQFHAGSGNAKRP